MPSHWQPSSTLQAALQNFHQSSSSPPFRLSAGQNAKDSAPARPDTQLGAVELLGVFPEDLVLDVFGQAETFHLVVFTPEIAPGFI